MVCYKLVIMIITYLDNHDYKNHDNLIIVTKNNHDISTFNDNCPTIKTKPQIFWSGSLTCECESVISGFANQKQ